MPGEGGNVAGLRDNLGTSHLKYGAAYLPYLATTLNAHTTDAHVTVAEADDDTDPLPTLESIEATETGLYQAIRRALGEQRVVLPPSAAVAGIYASVDRDRGVWKAPANVSVASVVGPVEKIGHAEQEGLNVDPTGGKSINAIRAFNGRGTLIWGARTLAGNDNEWRYVPVRRLFNMIEESSRKASAFAVFEPNDQTTWLKVRGMIESYLYGLWEKGAFAGSTPESAYFVHVGLGKTMTAQDVLEAVLAPQLEQPLAPGLLGRDEGAARRRRVGPRRRRDPGPQRRRRAADRRKRRYAERRRRRRRGR